MPEQPDPDKEDLDAIMVAFDALDGEHRTRLCDYHRDLFYALEDVRLRREEAQPVSEDVATTGTAPPGVLAEGAKDELEALWGDLEDARGSAIVRGTWTLRLAELEDRIKALTQIVGPTPWGDVPLPLLEDGVYQTIHRHIGVEAPVDMAGVARARALIEQEHRK